MALLYIPPMLFLTLSTTTAVTRLGPLAIGAEPGEGLDDEAKADAAIYKGGAWQLAVDPPQRPQVTISRGSFRIYCRPKPTEEIPPKRFARY